MRSRVWSCLSVVHRVRVTDKGWGRFSRAAREEVNPRQNTSLTPLSCPPHTQTGRRIPVHGGGEKAREPRGQGKATNQQARLRLGQRKQRHCHHQVMWGRVKELFHIPALAGMGAHKGKQARGREFGRGCHGGWYNWAAACSRFTPEPHSHSTPLPLPLSCSTAPHLGSQLPGRRKHTHQAEMDRVDRSQHRGQV